MSDEWHCQVGRVRSKATGLEIRVRKAPVPAENRPNVKILGVVTKLDLPPERILQGAIEEDLEGVVVLGFRRDGTEFFASTYPDAADVAWLCDRAKLKLMRLIDEYEEPPSKGSA